MVGSRFLHPVLGQSDKVNSLTDLEFRVWTQYILSADDFGVMRFSAVTIQSANDALHTKPTRTIQRALERLVDVGLLMTFEHQKRAYLCQFDWATRQPLKFPRATMNPAPPREVLERCDEATFMRFADHHHATPEAASEVPFEVASRASQIASKVISEATSEVTSGVTSEVGDEVPKTHLKAHLTSNGRLLIANGLREGFAEFWKTYPRRVGKEAAWKVWQKLKPGEELRERIRTSLGWQVQQPDWLKDGGRFIPYPQTWLNQARWEDEPPTVPTMTDANTKRLVASREFLES
jgi:hypothetical protein